MREFTITAADRSLADAIARAFPLERTRRPRRVHLVKVLGDGAREASNDEAPGFTEDELLQADRLRNVDKAAALADREALDALRLQVRQDNCEGRAP